MRALLAERFHLKVHLAPKEFPALHLAIAKGGPKLKAADTVAAGQPRISSRFSMDGGFQVVHLRAQQASMALLSQMLHQPGDPPLLDKTALAGVYDFTLDYTIERGGPGATGPPGIPPAPDLAVALRQQLGLQLVRDKALFDVVVVDSVDKLPTEN